MDIIGQKFGMLTVLSFEYKTKYRQKVYLCQCECGNQCTRLGYMLKKSLRDGRVSNCGCITNKNLIPGDKKLCSKAGSHRKDAFVNGSNVQMTFRPGTIITNTSGCQGVSWDTKIHKWHCYIGYQCYRANLGYYEDKSDAIRIRKLAEQAIKDNEFEDFYYQIRSCKLGEKQHKQFK